MDNIQAVSSNELDVMEIKLSEVYQPDSRLACQCILNEGTVEVLVPITRENFKAFLLAPSAKFE